MDNFKIRQGIIGSFVMLAGLVALVGGVYLAQYIWSIVLGSVFYAVNNASLTVTSATNTHLGTLETSFFSNSTLINNGVTFAAGLIIVGVVLVVFGGLIYAGYKKVKGGGKGGNLGY